MQDKVKKGRGRPKVENVYKFTISVSMSEPQRELLKEFASAEGRRVSEYVRDLIAASLPVEDAEKWRAAS